jgi:hypothetical protein
MKARLPWIVVHALLGLVVLRYWHLLLLKQHLDRPLIVATWLAAGLVLLLAARSLARRTPASDRSRLQRAYAALEGPELALLALLLVMLFLFHWGFARAASDGREYFVQVRSLVLDRDLDFANENASFGVRGTAGNFAFGAPLLWVPFFALAHLWLGLLNLFGAGYSLEGYFNPYQRAVGLGSLVYGYAALILAYRLLIQYFSRWLAAATTIAVTCGSFVIWYLVVDNSMSHAVSMFAVTLFVYFWHQTRGDTSVRRWALLGAAAGLMSLVRWQNVLFVVFPAAEALGRLVPRLSRRGSGRIEDTGDGPPVNDRAADPEGLEPAGASTASAGRAPVGASRRAATWEQTAAAYAAFGMGWIVTFSPQLYFWKVVRGGWLAMPAGAHGAQWTSPALGDVLFSPDRGLFSWTPLLLLAVLGLIPFARRHPRLGALLLAAFALQIYINATVEWFGHGFGARRFANCMLVFAIGLAALLQWMKQRPALAPALVIGGLVVLNDFFMLGMQSSRLPPSGDIPFQEMVGATTSRLGNPFSLPMGLLTAMRFGGDLALYERLGSQTFNNLLIDVGGANDSRFLVRGWSGPEAAGELSFRWSDGAESSLVVPLKAAADYALEVRCAPFDAPGAELQVVEVWVNDQVAGRFAAAPGLQEHRLRLAGGLLRAGFNEIRFRYGWTASPRSLGLSDDARELAVQFDTIALLREGE